MLLRPLRDPLFHHSRVGTANRPNVGLRQPQARSPVGGALKASGGLHQDLNVFRIVRGSL
jgi:hypothetical protein